MARTLFVWMLLAAVPVLAHRIILRPELWAARVSTVEVVNDVLRRVPTPKVEAS